MAFSKEGQPNRVPMARCRVGAKGQKIRLLTNHFKVGMTSFEDYFYQYSVAFYYEDGNPVDAKGVGRKIMEKLHQTYELELARKKFAYDGEESLFTIGPLPGSKLEFNVVFDDVSSSRTTRGSPDGSPGDRKRSQRQPQLKTYKVHINYATKIPIQAIADALRGRDSEHYQEAVRVLDIILRQHVAKQGCLLVRQSFFHNEPRNFVDLGGGVLGCRGFHASFRATQGGLSLNMDVSTTMIVQPGPVTDFLLANQNARDPSHIDWSKAKRTLKSLRVKVTHTNMEYKITGFSEKPCREQTFVLKQRGEGELEMTVYQYFTEHRQMLLQFSGDFPCINVGKPKRPTFIPLECCSLVSLQHYTKSLTDLQRASLVEKSRQKPQERMRTLTDALKTSNYKADPLLGSAGISISDQFTQVEGRVLPTPKLRVGNEQDLLPRNGRWNFNNKTLVEPIKLERWAVVNFSARCDVRKLCLDLQRCGRDKGVAPGKE